MILALLLLSQPAFAVVRVLPAAPPGLGAVSVAPAAVSVSLVSPASLVSPRAVAAAAVAAALAVASPAQAPAAPVAVAAQVAVAQAAPRFAPAAVAAAATAKSLAAPLARPSAASWNGVFDGGKAERRGDDPRIRSNVRFVKTFLGPLVRTVYPTKVTGAENIPAEGPVLLIGNHPSYLDPVIAGMSAGRPVRFLMYKAYYESPLKGWLAFLNPLISGFLKRMGAIPLAPLEAGNGPKAIQRSLEAARDALLRGEVVGLFPEGHVTRDGEIDEFMRGFTFIIRGTGAAVVPFGLSGPWGSMLSFGPKRSWLSRLFSRRQLSIAFGEPIDTRDAGEARAAVAALAAK